MSIRLPSHMYDIRPVVQRLYCEYRSVGIPPVEAAGAALALVIAALHHEELLSAVDVELTERMMRLDGTLDNLADMTKKLNRYARNMRIVTLLVALAGAASLAATLNLVSFLMRLRGK